LLSRCGPHGIYAVPDQADLLATHFERVILTLDGDEAGRQGGTTIAQALDGRLSLSAISLADGHQPDQLSPEEIERLFSANAADARKRC
jgi:DNA primase